MGNALCALEGRGTGCMGAVGAVLPFFGRGGFFMADVPVIPEAGGLAALLIMPGSLQHRSGE